MTNIQQVETRHVAKKKISLLRRCYAAISNRVRLWSSVIYDMRRFSKWSFAFQRPVHQRQMEAFLTMQYHSLEKGLALKSPREGFGSERIAALCDLLTDYIEAYGHDEISQVCLNVLTSYRSFSNAKGYTYNIVDQTLDRYGARPPAHSEGGLRGFSKQELLDATNIDFPKFVNTRHSVRNFSDSEVDVEVIAEAIRIAQKTPSVCNRQSCRVHVYLDEAKRNKVLSHQNGNRGFGNHAKCVLIITSDLQCFSSPGERFQSWIDGGMFSMSLIYALHAAKLGSCCLNWSATSDRDRRMRAEAGIADSEVVMMMLAVGYLPDELSVAYSPRRPLDKVMEVH